MDDRYIKNLHLQQKVSRLCMVKAEGVSVMRLRKKETVRKLLNVIEKRKYGSVQGIFGLTPCLLEYKSKNLELRKLTEDSWTYNLPIRN